MNWKPRTGLTGWTRPTGLTHPGSTSEVRRLELLPMNQAGNILLIRLKSIGDIVFTLPAVHRIRTHFPGTRLFYLTSLEHAPLLRGFAPIDEVLTLDREVYRRKRLPEICRETANLVRRLRRARFGLVVDFQGYGETALLTRLAGAPQRWGSVYRSGRRWAYTKGPIRNDALHPADWNLNLLEQGGLEPRPIRNEFRLPSDALEEAREFISKHGLGPARPTLFIQPFSSAADKAWPLEKSLALARHWRSSGLQIIFGGGPADRGALESARAAGFVVSAGVPLLVTAGLMHFSSLVFGPDTGLVHLAVALGRRVVMVINSCGPGRTIPYQHPEWALTPRQGQAVACVSVEEAIAATTQALADATAGKTVRSAQFAKP